MTSSLPTPPAEYLCPLTKKLMRDVVVSRYGSRFERQAILDWLNNGNNYCPVTGNPLRPSNLVSDKKHQWEIQYWASKNGYEDQVKPLTEEEMKEQFGDDPLSPTSGVAEAGEILKSLGGIASVAVPPSHFICPLTKEIMKEPMISKTNVSYERKAILDHLNNHGDVCPVTKQELTPSGLIPNKKLEWEINQWQLHYGPDGYEQMSKLELESKLSKAEMISRDFQLCDILKALIVTEANEGVDDDDEKNQKVAPQTLKKEGILSVLDDVVDTIDDL